MIVPGSQRQSIYRFVPVPTDEQQAWAITIIKGNAASAAMAQLRIVNNMTPTTTRFMPLTNC